MLANIQPSHPPMKRATAVKQRGLFALASIVAAGIVVALTGALHFSRPNNAASVQAVGVHPANGVVMSGGRTSSVPLISGWGTAASAGDDSHMFHGYACTIDCSGHKAGYNWAKDQGLTDPARCPIAPRNLMSLTEGCWAATGREGPYAQRTN